MNTGKKRKRKMGELKSIKNYIALNYWIFKLMGLDLDTEGDYSK